MFINTIWEPRQIPGYNCMLIIETSFYDDTKVWQDDKVWFDNGGAGKWIARNN